MTKDIKDSISILIAFCFACTIETSETSEATQVADGLYKVDGVSKTVHISPEDIMYEIIFVKDGKEFVISNEQD